MSSLTPKEKRDLEKLLGMATGYVANFSDRSFKEFVYDSVKKEIYDDKYSYDSGSKANRLRAFWGLESDQLVGQLLRDLIEHVIDIDLQINEQILIENCQSTSQRLLNSAESGEIFDDFLSEQNFSTVVRAIKSSIDKSEYDSALDRLHTFSVKLFRQLCKKHGVDCSEEKPLHSLSGEYIKILESKGKLHSEMTKRILKSSISILAAFNTVRNNQSLAHDNSLLNNE